MSDGMGRRISEVFHGNGRAPRSRGRNKGGCNGARRQQDITEVDKVTIWVLTDNYYDALRPDAKFTKRYRVVPGKSIHAEHGLSYYVETVVNGKTTSCMLDYGLDPVGVMNNIAMLGLDLGKANAFSLSHGHFDHWMAAVEILKKNQSKISQRDAVLRGRGSFSPKILAPSRD